MAAEFKLIDMKSVMYSTNNIHDNLASNRINIDQILRNLKGLLV